jgi:hypothetical protein
VSEATSEERRLGRKGWVLEQPEDCGQQEDGSFVLQLEEPIQLGKGEPTTRLRFRRPKGRDFREFPTEPKKLGEFLTMAARLCGRPSAELDDLCAGDVQKVIEIVGFSMASSPAEIGSSPKVSLLST